MPESKDSFERDPKIIAVEDARKELEEKCIEPRPSLVDVILVSVGNRAVASMNVLSIFGEGCEEDNKQKIGIVCTLLHRLGIYYKVKEHGVIGPYIHTEIFLGNNEAVDFLSEKGLIHSGVAQRGKDEIKKIGTLLGYPDTAVDAFVQGGTGTVATRELPIEIRNDDAMAFQKYQMSKAHWREEFEIARQRANLVKSLSPEIYETTVYTYRQRVPKVEE